MVKMKESEKFGKNYMNETNNEEKIEDIVPTHERILQGKEPDPSEYHDYASREVARGKAYGGKPPNGFQSWGDYWKSY